MQRHRSWFCLVYEIQMNAESYIFAAAGFVTFLMSSRLRSFSVLAFDIRPHHDQQWSRGHPLWLYWGALAQRDVIGPAQAKPPVLTLQRQ